MDKRRAIGRYQELVREIGPQLAQEPFEVCMMTLTVLVETLAAFHGEDPVHIGQHLVRYLRRRDN